MLQTIKGFSLVETILATVLMSSIFVMSAGLLAYLKANNSQSENSKLVQIRDQIYSDFSSPENCNATFKTLTKDERRPNAQGVRLRTAYDKNGDILYDSTTVIDNYLFDYIRFRNFRQISTGSMNEVWIADFTVRLKENGTYVESEPRDIILRGPGNGWVTGCGMYREKYWDKAETTEGYFTDFDASIGHSAAANEKVDIVGTARLTSNANNGFLVEMRNSPLNYVYMGLQNPGQLTISGSPTRDFLNLFSNNNLTLGESGLNSAKLELVDTMNASNGLLALSHGWAENYGFYVDTETTSGDNLRFEKVNGNGIILVESSLHIGDNNGLAGGYRFYVNGAAGGTSAWQVVSDKRLKKDIVEIKDKDILKRLLKLNGYYFKWKDTNKQDFGVIAQEVQKQFPELVHSSKEGTLYVKKDLLALYLAKAIVQVNHEQNKLSQDIESIIKEVCNLNPKEELCL